MEFNLEIPLPPADWHGSLSKKQVGDSSEVVLTW